jgi:aryl-alcohol dehydrogenase-like predicted oxidoreductase
MTAHDAIPARPLGRTGARVSLVGLGGFHLGKVGSDAEAIRLVRTALDAGMTFLDNSWDYHGGRSERRMGQALRDGYRDRAFLMTKIDGRDRKSALSQLEESLRRLETDHVDLLQIHEVIRESDADRVFAPGGAVEGLVDARAAGKVRYLGFTGHKSPRFHLRMLDAARAHGFRFDAVQMPLNVMDAHFDSFERQVLPVLVREGIGVIGMKSMGDPAILDSGTVTPTECLRYAMHLPTSVVVTGCESARDLEQAIAAGRTFRPLTDAEVAGLLARTAEAARAGRFERYKTTDRHDGTEQHPEWLGEARPGAAG